MFEINLDKTVAEIGAISRMESVLNSAVYEINNAVSSLKEFTELDSEISELSGISAEFEREAYQITRINDSLDNILLLYSQCEKMICEEEYQTSFRFARRTPVELAVPNLFGDLDFGGLILY